MSVLLCCSNIYPPRLTDPPTYLHCLKLFLPPHLIACFASHAAVETRRCPPTQRDPLLRVDHVHPVDVQRQRARDHHPERRRRHGHLLRRPRAVHRGHVGVPARQPLRRDWCVSFSYLLSLCSSRPAHLERARRRSSVSIGLNSIHTSQPFGELLSCGPRRRARSAPKFFRRSGDHAR